MTVPLEDVKVAWPECLPRDQDKIEIRLYAGIVTGTFIFNLIEPAFYVLVFEDSVMNRVAALTHHRELLVSIFLGCAVASMPHFVVLALLPQFLVMRSPRRLACMAALTAAIVWALLAVIAWPLDYWPLSYIYAATAVGYLGLAGVFAFSLNSQQLRRRYREPASPH